MAVNSTFSHVQIQHDNLQTKLIAFVFCFFFQFQRLFQRDLRKCNLPQLCIDMVGLKQVSIKNIQNMITCQVEEKNMINILQSKKKKKIKNNNKKYKRIHFSACK